MQRSLVTLLCVLLLAAAFGGGALAQSTSATLTGVVRTSGGTPLGDAVVTVRSEESGTVRNTVTDAAGRYRFDLLTPGAWTVLAQVESGAASDPQRVVLGLQQTARVDLAVGGNITETVEVHGSTPVIDPQRIGGELRIGAREADAMPLSKHQVTDLALLDSSVNAAPSGTLFGEHGSVFVVNGQSGRGNSFLVDGLDNNDHVSGTTLGAYFSPQVIREFVVLTHQFAPEFGRAAGGVLNIVTQKGTNQPAGEVSVSGIAPSWNAPGEFVGSLPRGSERQNTDGRFALGVRYGGPIVKDRAFWFAAYDHQQSDEVRPFTGVGRNGRQGGIFVAPVKGDSLFARADFNLGSDDFLMLRLSGDRRTTDGLNVASDLTPEFGFALKEQSGQFAASLTNVVSPAVLNESRFLAGWSDFAQDANSARPGASHPSGSFGGNPLNRQRREETRLQFVDNLTVRAGTHTLKFGVDLSHSRTNVATRFNPNGNFLYNTDKPFQPGDCGDLIFSQVAEYGYDPIPCNKPDGSPGGVPGLIGTYPVVYTLIDGAPAATLNDTRVALFAQDGWQPAEAWRIDYGLRYDLSTFTLPRSSVVASRIPNGGARKDKDNIAPRLGLSWTPLADGRLVVRAGAGVFYDKLVLAFPALTAIASGTRIGMFFPQGQTLEITENVVEEVGIGAIREGLVFPPQYTMRFSTGTRLYTPYSTQYNLGLELRTSARSALRLDAIRALGYHQPLILDLNGVKRVDDAGTPAAAPVHYDDRVGSISSIVTEGRSWYTGATLGWHWQSGAGSFSASYTWSLTQDLGPDPLKGGLALPPQSLDLGRERGRSDSDRRHRLTLYGAAGIPWIDVRASVVVQAMSGAPFDVTIGRDTNVDGTTSDRPGGVGRNAGADAPLGVINAIREQENARYGMNLAPVRSLEEPDFLQVDVRFDRYLFGRERRFNSSVYAQVLNVFDRVNAAAVDGRIISARFGQPTALAGPPRTIELGIRAGF